VVQDVNRYTNRKIEFADPSIGELLFTGTVFVDQLDGWLAALPGAFPLKVVERGSYRLLQHAG
jgi:transmembrane sensor